MILGERVLRHLVVIPAHAGWFLSWILPNQRGESGWAVARQGAELSGEVRLVTETGGLRYLGKLTAWSCVNRPHAVLYPDESFGLFRTES